MQVNERARFSAKLAFTCIGDKANRPVGTAAAPNNKRAACAMRRVFSSTNIRKSSLTLSRVTLDAEMSVEKKPGRIIDIVYRIPFALRSLTRCIESDCERFYLSENCFIFTVYLYDDIGIDAT